MITGIKKAQMGVHIEQRHLIIQAILLLHINQAG